MALGRKASQREADSHARESARRPPSPIPAEGLITFQVRGLPVPQGSTRAFVVKGKPIITSSAKGLATWRRLVADVAQDYAPLEPWSGPVGIDLHFGIPKPKSAPKRRRVWPDKRPDLDKLARAVLDALTYVIFADDSQVVRIRAEKDYGAPGVTVEVRRILDEAMLES